MGPGLTTPHCSTCRRHICCFPQFLQERRGNPPHGSDRGWPTLTSVRHAVLLCEEHAACMDHSVAGPARARMFS